MRGLAARPWWQWHLALGGIVLVAVSVMPFGAERITLQFMASLSVIPAVIVGIRKHRPARRLGWWALVAAVSIAVISNIAWPVLQGMRLLDHTPAVDLLYYLTYPVLGLALALLPPRPPGAPFAGYTEAGIITSGAAVVWWILLVDPLIVDGLQQVDQPHIAVFPLLDMALLALGLRLLLIVGPGLPAYTMITVATASLLVADTAMFVSSDSGGFMTTVHAVDPPMPAQICWLLANLLIGAGALHPSMATEVAPPADAELTDKVGASRIYVATVVATPILTGMFLLHELAGDSLGSADVVVPVGATALTSALVVLRMRQLNQLARRRAGELEASLRKEASLQQELRDRAQRDELTALPNRVLLDDRLTAALADGSPGALLILDVDEFKEVNDRFGHAAGDDMLIAIADRLRELTDGQALLARLGSDEFGMLFGHAGVDEVTACADQVLVAMRRPVRVQGAELFPTASIGVRMLDDDLVTGDLLRDAYLALHAAKAAGRDRVAVFDRGMREKRLATARTIERLRGAIGRDELVVYFQPLVRLADERMYGVEALLRWKPAGERMIPPDQFIPTAEDSGLIVPIGAHVLRESCRVAAEWHRLTGAVVSVNVSPRQLREPDFGTMVLDALRSSALPPEALILEITEGVLVASGQVTEQAIGHLSMLRSRGVRVAVDDFGTGYSSLAYLRDLPIDHIKIDRSFMPVPGQSDEKAARTMVKTIIDLASGLRLGTIAEGVETKEQAELLRELGCEKAQGFYFARPVPAVEAAVLLAESAAAAHRV